MRPKQKHEADETSGYRHARLERLLTSEVRALVSDDVVDPRLADVEITRGVLSIDYRHLRCHFVVARKETTIERAEAERALERATPFLRARLADAIDLKRTPELRFVFDGVVADR